MTAGGKNEPQALDDELRAARLQRRQIRRAALAGDTGRPSQRS